MKTRNVFYCLWLLLSLSSMLKAQYNNPVDPISLCAEVQPAAVTYGELMSINFKNYHEVPAGVNINDLVSSVRYFHLMNEGDGRDFRYSNPNNFSPTVCTNPILNPITASTNCYTCGDPNQMGSARSRYCLAKKDGVTQIIASIEALFFTRPWYDKNFYDYEWGDNLADAFNNARNYGQKFAENYCPKESNKTCLVDVMELGNEPWGIPGTLYYKAVYRGLVQGVNDYYTNTNPNINYNQNTTISGLNPNAWRMKLASGAYQFFQATTFYGTNDNVSTMPSDLWPYLEYVNVHNYAFGINRDANGNIQSNTGALDRQPESPDGKFLAGVNTVQWRKNNQNARKLAATEFGWDSQIVGEQAQALYIVRAFLMYGRFDYDLACVYEIYDEGYGNGLYETSGLIKANKTTKKEAFHAMKRLKANLGNKLFLDMVNTKDYLDTDNQYMAYLVGGSNRKPTHLVLWLPKNVNFGANMSSQNVSLTLPHNLTLNANSSYLKLNGNLTNQNASVNSIISSSSGSTYTLSASPVPYFIPLNFTNYTYAAPSGNLTVNSCGTSSCTLSASPSSSSINAVGGSTSINISGSNSVTISGNTNSVFSTSVNGSTVTVSASANNSGSSRSTTITVSASGCTPVSFTVSQANNGGGGGCTTNTSCAAVSLKGCADRIEVSLNNSSPTIIKIYQTGPSYSLVKQVCNDYNSLPNCSAGFSDVVYLSPGIYNVEIQGAGCSNVNVEVGGGGCTDNDNDSFCNDVDCNDNNANIGAPGSPCDDGDPNTSNDVLQADCSCAGTPGPSCTDYNNCSGVVLSACPSKIELEVTGSNVNYVKVMNQGWTQIGYLCKNWGGNSDNCNSGYESSLIVSPGTYILEVNYTDNTPACYITNFDVPTGSPTRQFTTENNYGIELYPNPAKEKIQIELAGISQLPGQAIIYDIHGKRLASKSIGDQSHIEIDVSHFSTGMYFLHFEIENIRVNGIRFVVDNN